jgi:hypothetical protein
MPPPWPVPPLHPLVAASVSKHAHTPTYNGGKDNGWGQKRLGGKLKILDLADPLKPHICLPQTAVQLYTCASSPSRAINRSKPQTLKFKLGRATKTLSPAFCSHYGLCIQGEVATSTCS